MASGTATDPESAVRAYLLFLEDPASITDHERIAELEAQRVMATDPVTKLRLFEELKRLRSSDGAPLKDGFVAHAKAWAEANDITVEAFRSLDVPAAVLAEAGFEVTVPKVGRRGRPSGPGGAGAGGAGSRRRAAGARSVGIGEVKDHVCELSAPFTLTQVRDDLGGSIATIDKAVKELIDEGAIRRVGPDPDYHGRGRAPYLYERI